MVWSSRQKRPSPWELARKQHGLVTRRQLQEVGISDRAIEHRLATGRLHRVRRGIYLVGRPGLTQRGEWLAAVLACGDGAALSHFSAGGLWELVRRPRRVGSVPVDVSLSVDRHLEGPRLRLHRPSYLPDSDLTSHCGIPVTTPVRTLIDLATSLTLERVEAAVNAADKHKHVDPETLRRAIEPRSGQRGVPALRKVLDRRTFALTDSDLERRFLRLARRAGLPKPQTQVDLNGFRVDFFWPELGLVVETDGLRYHRTPGQQARDRRRDQAHVAAGLTPLRFTHAQVAYEPGEVERTLLDVARRLTLEGPAAA